MSSAKYASPERLGPTTIIPTSAWCSIEREGYVTAKVLEGSGGGVKEAIVRVYCLLANECLAAFS